MTRLECRQRVESGRSCSTGEQVTAEPFEAAQDSGRCKLGMRLEALGQRASTQLFDRLLLND